MQPAQRKVLGWRTLTRWRTLTSLECTLHTRCDSLANRRSCTYSDRSIMCSPATATHCLPKMFTFGVALVRTNVRVVSEAVEKLFAGTRLRGLNVSIYASVGQFSSRLRRLFRLYLLESRKTSLNRNAWWLRHLLNYCTSFPWIHQFWHQPFWNFLTNFSITKPPPPHPQINSKWTEWWSYVLYGCSSLVFQRPTMATSFGPTRFSRLRVESSANIFDENRQPMHRWLL